ncbi:MAG: hypothetical protein V1835_04620 [Candidatus Micrarchaeota archaeon]
MAKLPEFDKFMVTRSRKPSRTELHGLILHFNMPKVGPNEWGSIEKGLSIVLEKHLRSINAANEGAARGYIEQPHDLLVNISPNPEKQNMDVLEIMFTPQFRKSKLHQSPNLDAQFIANLGDHKEKIIETVKAYFEARERM